MSEFTVLNPATEEAVTTVIQASAEEADAAISRAAAAQERWRAVSPGDRAGLLRRFAAAVDAHVDELADLEVGGSGHPVGQARWEAGHVRDVLLYYSAAPERLIGKQIPVPGGLNVTFHEPVGVVGLIVPWNFPMPILAWGMAPALAAGNTVVAKPAEMTPLTAIRIGELAAEAGLPDGVCDNAGQDCCARARILVQRSVLDRFMELLEPAVKNVAVGDPASPGTEMGPLISAAHRQHVASYVPEGAAVAFRGSAPDGPGFWFPPTVLAPVRADDRAYTDHVFGPVVTLTPFENEAAAVSIAT